MDLELRLARFEQLITRRPLLLNSVLLRQNPHNVHEWHKRVKLYEGKPREVGKPVSEQSPGVLGYRWECSTSAPPSPGKLSCDVHVKNEC